LSSKSSSSNKFKPCSLDDQVKKDDSDIYDLDENNYVVDREPAVLYTAKKDDQLFSSKILCPKMLLSKCFNGISSSSSSDNQNSYNNNSCLYNRILESDNLKLKQNHEKNNAAAAAALSQNGEPNIKAASSISDVVHQKKEVNTFVLGSGSGGKAASSTNGYLLDKNFKFIFIGLAIVFLVSLTSLCLTVYVLIKRRNHVLYQPTEGYPHDER
jgi:hypothetical protein